MMPNMPPKIAPFTTFKLLIDTEATTAFLLLQIEQLHFRRFSNPFGKVNSNSTVPQWQVSFVMCFSFISNFTPYLLIACVPCFANANSFCSLSICVLLSRSVFVSSKSDLFTLPCIQIASRLP